MYREDEISEVDLLATFDTPDPEPEISLVAAYRKDGRVMVVVQSPTPRGLHSGFARRVAGEATSKANLGVHENRGLDLHIRPYIVDADTGLPIPSEDTPVITMTDSLEKYRWRCEFMFNQEMS